MPESEIIYSKMVVSVNEYAHGFLERVGAGLLSESRLHKSFKSYNWCF